MLCKLLMRKNQRAVSQPLCSQLLASCAGSICRCRGAKTLATATPLQDAVYKKRHMWTTDQDDRLRELVASKGNAWTEIAAELGIEGSPMKARRRWEVLQPQKADVWTRSEDTKLARAISDCTQHGHIPGERGWWVAVSQKMSTGRSPRQCYTRWVRTLLPMQGVALPVTRFKGIRGWHWTNNEVGRLRAAIAEITEVRDSPEAVAHVEQSEPWLVIPKNPARNVNSQYWVYVAGQVGTRTPAQCVEKQKLLTLSKPPSAMDIEQIKRLVQCVRGHGRRWKLLSKEYFPERSPVELLRIYRQWQSLESKHNVGDMLKLDPFAMIQDFDGHSAMRPTGKDGFYHRDGPLVRVSQVGKPTAFTPYYLALVNASPHRRKQPKIMRALGLPDSSAGGPLHIESMDKLVAAVTRYRNDWVSISREVGLPIYACRRQLNRLASNLGSVKRLISDAELESLCDQSGVSPESDGKKR